MSNLSTELIFHPTATDLQANEAGQMSARQAADYTASKRGGARFFTLFFGIIAVVVTVSAVVSVMDGQPAGAVVFGIVAAAFGLGASVNANNWLIRTHPIPPISKETGKARLSSHTRDSRRYHRLLIKHTSFRLRASEFRQIHDDELYTVYYFTERTVPYLVAIVPSTEEIP